MYLLSLAASIGTQLRTAADVPVEVFGGLVLPQVGVHPAGPEAGHEVAGDHFGGAHQFQEQVVVGLFQGDQGFDVSFGEQDHVVFPDRVGVVKGKDPFVLEVHRHVRKAFQDLVAIEVAGG